MKTLWMGMLLSLTGVVALPVAVRAQDLGGVRQRMEARLAQVDAAKEKGQVGETNRGLLEARGSTDDAIIKLVEAENADRQAAYAAIARNTQTSPEAVATARARQIATGSKSGVWLQREDGAWYRK